MENKNTEIENFISWVAEQMQIDFKKAQKTLEEMSDDQLLQLTEAYKKSKQTPIKKTGGKIEQFISKFQPGGSTKVLIEKNAKTAKNIQKIVQNLLQALEM